MIFAAIDFETSHREPDSACAVAVVRVSTEAPALERSFSALLRPPEREAWMFHEVHGITREACAGAQAFADVLPSILELLAGVEFVAAHNAPFDRRVFEACCRTAKVEPPRLVWRDTVVVARQTWGIFPTHLGDVCRRLEIPLDHHHDALCDANACAQIVVKAHERSRRGVR